MRARHTHPKHPEPSRPGKRTAPTVQERRRRIREIVARNEIHTQEQLRELLRAEDCLTTQSTLSRDLREIGVLKGQRGYTIPAGPDRRSIEVKALAHSLRESARQIQRSGTMIVIVTRRGGAPAVADAITHAGLSQVLGAVGGVDTVLAATGSVTQAEDLVQFLRKIGR